MTAVLEVGSHIITAERVFPLLADYQILPQLLREIIIDQAIAPFSCTVEETADACQQFYRNNQPISETEQQVWMDRHSMTSEQLETLATRGLRLEKFKRATWGHKLESYFLKRKGQLDQAIFSLIRTKDREIAQELYFRIQEGEQSFVELAREYSQGPESQTGGFVGPVALSILPSPLAQVLSASQPGQLSPLPLGEWLMIVRLEKLVPAQLDELMRQRLINELFEAWLQEQLSQLTLLR